MLAYCSGKDVCLVNTEKLSPTSENFPRTPGGLATPGSVLARTLRDSSRQVVSGLWEVPAELFLGQHQGPIDGSLRDGMNRLRNEFEYSIVQAPDAGPIGIAESLAHLSDGLILVLHAHSTRRAVALKVQTNLQAAGVKVLGAVLMGREFPIPEMLYKRL
jgi:hypothetical protein